VTNKLTELLDSVLGLSEPAEALAGPGGDEAVRAQLAALLDAAGGDEPARALPPAIWAAYLQGRLDTAERERVLRQIAASPALAREAVSMIELLDQVAAHPAVVPAELVVEVAGLGKPAFDAAERLPDRGRRSILDRLAPERRAGWEAGLRGALKVVLGQGRQSCEIVVEAAADLLASASDAWSFAPQPALVTRTRSGRPAVVDGVRSADGAAMTVTAEEFEGVRRIEIVLRHYPAGQPVPIILVADEHGDAPMLALDPSIEPDLSTGTLRIHYEAEGLAAGDYVVLIGEPNNPQS
jgi:hypothetical protein